MLLILNLPLVGIWIRLLQTPYRLLYPAIILFCLIGIYSERSQTFDIMICALVVAAGYILQKLDCDPAPLILGLILGPILEENLRRAMLISDGDPTVFITRPISGTILALTLVIVVVFALPTMRRKQHEMMARTGAE
jgi:TctA family transporter